MVLVDTSVWIDFLKNHQNQKVYFLENLLEEGEAGLCEVTYAEICFGAKDKKQFQKYAKEFSNLPFLKLPNHWHQEIAEMGHALKMA